MGLTFIPKPEPAWVSVGGAPGELAFDVFARTLGPGMAIFSLATAAKPYRRGEKWAWYVLWYWPLLFLIHAIAFGSVIHGLPLFIIALMGLLGPYRKFFPRK